MLCALYKQLKISVTEKMFLQGAWKTSKDSQCRALNPRVRYTALALHLLRTVRVSPTKVSALSLAGN